MTGEVINKTQVFYNTGLTINEDITTTHVGKSLENLALYESVRLVAGGLRLWKTSKRDNESGVLRALYAKRGIAPVKSIADTVNEPYNSEVAAKVFIAGDHCCHMGRDGLLIQANYKPRDSSETQ